jgi:hypothetical protein
MGKRWAICQVTCEASSSTRPWRSGSFPAWVTRGSKNGLSNAVSLSDYSERTPLLCASVEVFIVVLLLADG